jgi:RNA recognition motif-containing protein
MPHHDYSGPPPPQRERDMHQQDGKRNHDTYAKLFVGGLSFETKERTIGETFARMGRVKEVILVVDKQTRKPKGYAFVTFEHEDSAHRALREMQGIMLDGRNLRLELSGSREGGGGGGDHQQRVDDINGRGGRGGDAEPIRGTRGRIREDLEDVTDHSKKACQVYVGSLNYEMRDPDLHAAFQGCGEIVEASVLMDRANPNRSRGYGFITFTTAESAQNAIDQFHNAMVKGRRITVNHNTARRLEKKGSQLSRAKNGGGDGGGNSTDGQRARSRSRERR